MGWGGFLGGEDENSPIYEQRREGEVRLAGGLVGWWASLYTVLYTAVTKQKKLSEMLCPSSIVFHQLSDCLGFTAAGYIPLALWDLCLGSHCSSVGISLLGSRAQNE